MFEGPGEDDSQVSERKGRFGVEGGMECPGRETVAREVFKLSGKMERETWRVCGLVLGCAESVNHRGPRDKREGERKDRGEREIRKLKVSGVMYGEPNCVCERFKT